MVIPGWNLLLANTWKVKNLIGLPGESCQVNLSLGLYRSASFSMQVTVSPTKVRLVTSEFQSPLLHFCQASWLGCQLYHPMVLPVEPRVLQAQRAVVHDHPAGEAALLKLFLRISCWPTWIPLARGFDVCFFWSRERIGTLLVGDCWIIEKSCCRVVAAWVTRL